MTLLEQPYTYLSHEDVLADMTSDELEAFFDLLLLAVMIDGRVTAAELDQLDAEMAQTPAARMTEAMWERFQTHIDDAQVELAGIIEDDDALDDFIIDRGDRIVGEAHRFAVMEMIAETVEADGLAPRENALLDQLGLTMGLGQEEIDGIVADIISRREED